MLPDLQLNDTLRLRKPHPCGSYEWIVVRLGADIGLECKNCGRRVMLTRRELMEKGRQTRSNWWIPALIGLLILVGLVFLILSIPGVSRTAATIPAGLDTVLALGTALVSPDAYVLPFEVASILLLAALIGAAPRQRGSSEA